MSKAMLHITSSTLQRERERDRDRERQRERERAESSAGLIATMHQDDIDVRYV